MHRCRTRGLVLLGAMVFLLQAITVLAVQQGYLDDGFDGDGKLLLQNRGLGVLSGIHLPPLPQDEGKVVVAAYSDTGFLLARFTAEGNLDTTFGESGMTRILDVNVEQQAIRGLVRQRDGQLLLVGSADKTGGTPGTEFFIKRFSADGILDEQFGDFGQVITPIALSAAAWTAIEQADGKLLVGGAACVEAEPPSPTGQFVCHNAEFALARYLPDGQLDTAFGWKGILIVPITRLNEGIRALYQQQDGKLLLLGKSGDDAAWARINDNGALDKDFAEGKGKAVLLDSVSGESPMFALQQENGKLLIAGSRVVPGQVSFVVQRYKANGILDKSFGNKGSTVQALGASSQLTAFTGLADGGLLAVGEVCFRRKENKAKRLAFCAESDIVLARYQANGQPDEQFGDHGLLVTSVTDVRDVPLSVFEYDDRDLLVTARSCQAIQCASYDFSLVRYTMYPSGMTDETGASKKRRWFFWF